MVEELKNNVPVGKVIWITGLSGSGKTTIAELIYKKAKLNNLNYVLLDGDKLRGILLEKNDLKSYELSNRIALGLQYAKLCKLISEQNINVIISTISLYKEVFQYLDKNVLNHYKIYLNFSNEILKKRNQKSLYSNFDVGRATNVVGLDIVYDIPVADLTIDDDMDGQIEKIAQLVIQKCELTI
jgi:adenylylsulfate kinase-like enzyme